MSYRKPDTGNPEEDRRLVQEDFEMIAPKVLEHGSEQHFLVWLDKIRAIDRDMAVAYLKQHAEELPPGRLRIAAAAMRELRELLPGRTPRQSI